MKRRWGEATEEERQAALRRAGVVHRQSTRGMAQDRDREGGWTENAPEPTPEPDQDLLTWIQEQVDTFGLMTLARMAGVSSSAIVDILDGVLEPTDSFMSKLRAATQA